MRKVWLAALCAAGILALAGSSDAAIYTITYTGTVSEGGDLTGIFSTPGANLAGLSYQAVFTVNTGLSGQTLLQEPGIVQLSGNGSASPVSAIVTIGGVTYDFGGSSGIDLRDDNNGAQNTFSQTAESVDGTTTFDPGTGLYSAEMIQAVGGANSVNPVSLDLSQPDDATGAPFDMVESNIFIEEQTFSDPNGPRSYPLYTYAYVNEATETSKLISGDPVPEPSAWALMMFGIAGAGAWLRRQKGYVGTASALAQAPATSFAANASPRPS